MMRPSDVSAIPYRRRLIHSVMPFSGMSISAMPRYNRLKITSVYKKDSILAAGVWQKADRSEKDGVPIRQIQTETLAGRRILFVCPDGIPDQD